MLMVSVLTVPCGSGQELGLKLIDPLRIGGSMDSATEPRSWVSAGASFCNTRVKVTDEPAGAVLGGWRQPSGEVPRGTPTLMWMTSNWWSGTGAGLAVTTGVEPGAALAW